MATAREAKRHEDDVFRQAVMDHALSMGMDPVRDESFLWLAEEALTADLPEEWEAVEDADGAQYYYNHMTGQSSWENPLDEPYRRLFLRLRDNPKVALEERQRRLQAGHRPAVLAGESQGYAASADHGHRINVADRERKMAEELGLNPLDMNDIPPRAPYANGGNQGHEDGGEIQPAIEHITDHRASPLADGEVDMQYKAAYSDGTTCWFSASVLYAEVPDLIHEYNNSILSSRAQATKSLEVQVEEERARVAALKRTLEEERARSEQELAALRDELDEERQNALDAAKQAPSPAGRTPGEAKEREALAQQLEDMAAAKRSLEHALGQVKQELNEEIESSLASRKRVVGLEAELDQVRRQCQQAEEDRTKAKQRASEAERRLRSREVNAAGATSPGGSVFHADDEAEAQDQQDLQRLRSELSSTANKLLASTEALEASRRQLNRAANERDVVQSALDKVKVELDLEFKTTARLRQDAQQAQDRADTLEREVQMVRHELTTALARASPQKKRATGSPLSPGEGGSADAAEFKALRDELSTLHDKLSLQKSELIDTQERLHAAERRATRAENERDVLQKALTQVKAELQQEFATSAGLRHEAQRAKDASEASARELRAAQEALVDIQEAGKKRSQADDGATRRIEDLTGAMHRLREQLHEKDAELDAAHAELIAVREDAQSLKRTHDRENAEREVLESSAQTAKEELAREAAQGAQMRRELAAAQAKIEELGALSSHNEAHEQQVADLEVKLRRAKEKARSLEQNLARCKDEMETAIRAHDARTGAANEQKLQEQEDRIREQADQLAAKTRRVAQLEQDIETLRNAESIDPMEFEAMKQTVAAVEDRLAEEIRKRRAIHNKLVDLQGNIRVYCRVRPVLGHETKSGKADVVVSFPNEGEIQLVQSLACRDQDDLFEFDQVFNPTSQQAQVYAQVEPLVQSALDGYNVCIFAYGQTGSGKTYTMDGSPSDRGVIHRTFQTLFATIEERKGLVEYAVEMSMLEIYNESIRDLFAPPVDPKQLPQNQMRKKLEVRRGPHGLHVPGLEQAPIDCMETVEELMRKGIQNRTVGRHNVNQHSSRSHLVVTITLVAKHEKFTTRSKLNLIDLAGSERLDKTNATGSMLTEAKNINKSLSALGNVIQALGNEKQDHVPFRDSKLTFLLQDSLSGSSKVLMFVNVSPVEWNAPETLCSLTFANRCRRTQLGQATKQKQ